MGIRLNKEPPKITFKKKDRGGVAFTPNTNGDTTFLDEETVARVLKEVRHRQRRRQAARGRDG